MNRFIRAMRRWVAWTALGVLAAATGSAATSITLGDQDFVSGALLGGISV